MQQHIVIPISLNIALNKLFRANKLRLLNLLKTQLNQLEHLARFKAMQQLLLQQSQPKLLEELLELRLPENTAETLQLDFTFFRTQTERGNSVEDALQI